MMGGGSERLLGPKQSEGGGAQALLVCRRQALHQAGRLLMRKGEGSGQGAAQAGAGGRQKRPVCVG